MAVLTEIRLALDIIIEHASTARQATVLTMTSLACIPHKGWSDAGIFSSSLDYPCSIANVRAVVSYADTSK